MVWTQRTIMKYSNNKQIKKIIMQTNNRKFEDLEKGSLAYNTFLNYELLFISFSIENEDETKEIFTRLNSVSQTLKPQEIRKAKYFSYNMLSIYDNSKKLKEQFIEAKVLTNAQIKRATDVELISTIYLSTIPTISNFKESVNATRKELDEFADKIMDIETTEFDETIDEIIKNCRKIIDNLLKISENEKIHGKYYFEIFYFLVYRKDINLDEITNFIIWINKEENEEQRFQFQPTHTRASSSRENSIKVFIDWVNSNENRKL